MPICKAANVCEPRFFCPRMCVRQRIVQNTTCNNTCCATNICSTTCRRAKDIEGAHKDEFGHKSMNRCRRTEMGHSTQACTRTSKQHKARLDSLEYTEQRAETTVSALFLPLHLLLTHNCYFLSWPCGLHIHFQVICGIQKQLSYLNNL